MKKQLLLMSACVLAYSSVALSQEVPADTLALPAEETAPVAEAVVAPVAEETAPVATEVATPAVAEEVAPSAEPVADAPVADAPLAEAPVATEDTLVAEAPATAEVAPVARPSFADNLVELLKQARTSGKIKSDGSFDILDDGFKVSGKLLCSDSEVESALQTIGTIFTTPDFKDEDVLSAVNKSLKCVSFSGIEFQDTTSSATFKGEFLYPAFKDGSTTTATFNGKKYNTEFSLDDNQQTLDLTVSDEKDNKLFILKLVYDTEKMGNLFELGFLAGLMGAASDGEINPETYAKLQTIAAKYGSKSFNAAHLLKMDSYRADGKPIFVLKGDTDDNFDAAGYSSTDKKFVRVKWDGQNFDFAMDYPKTDRRFVSAKITAPADFRQKYQVFVQSLAQTQGQVDPTEAMGTLLSGVKKELTLYGMNDKPLAQLAVNFNDTIQISTGTGPQPQDIINTAKLTIDKDDGICPIETITFDKAKPETLAVCGNNGCHDEQLATADQTIFPQLMACFGEVPMMATQFGDEMKAEFESLKQVYVPGFSEGYTLAMTRYKANEIVNVASMVAIVGMSKDGGNGGDASIADLGGLTTISEEVKDIITQDSDISSDKNGVVTIRLNGKNAKDLMPLLSDILGHRVKSGCTADSTTCVVDFQMQR